MATMNHGLYHSVRQWAFAFVFACAAVTLGFEAHLASTLLPYDSDLIIYGLAVSTATVLAVLAVARSSTPFLESVGLFVFSVLWVAMGGISVDRIGGVRCNDLTGDLNTGRPRTMKAAEYCKKTKVVMAFSWAEFSVITIMFLIVISLTTRARTYGAGSRVWNESISDLPWFGTWIGEDRQHYRPTYPMPSYGGPPSAYMPPPTAFSPGPGGVPSRIVIQAPPPGETVLYRPEDGYQQPMSSISHRV
ncbi:hypothetical protein CPB86DRAFT_739954 [Serendipita vermifera]|nr:hypothetical protein CPB86DRAFT_739954 [Serendipita vermifera]